ncbi:MAG: hypothetical protein LBG66_01960 [Gallionellaceae bacterium]|nr:hypothetical protein [Gallionellaceae bacterium]
MALIDNFLSASLITPIEIPSAIFALFDMENELRGENETGVCPMSKRLICKPRRSQWRDDYCAAQALPWAA